MPTAAAGLFGERRASRKLQLWQVGARVSSVRNEVVSEIQAEASEADRLTAVADLITADQRNVLLLAGLDEAELPPSLSGCSWREQKRSGQATRSSS